MRYNEPSPLEVRVISQRFDLPNCASIDTYLADLNVVVDHLGGAVDLIGLCQGGWLSLMYAARFPAKVRRLVLGERALARDVSRRALARRISAAARARSCRAGGEAPRDVCPSLEGEGR